jgi:hypothetical protein
MSMPSLDFYGYWRLKFTGTWGLVHIDNLPKKFVEYILRFLFIGYNLLYYANCLSNLFIISIIGLTYNTKHKKIFESIFTL